MSRLKTSDDNVFGGEWSIKKLDCVSAYLKSYLDVFKDREWADLWYIDAFCGSGFQGIKNNQPKVQSENEEIVDFIEGSAIRALKIASANDQSGRKSFNHFVFVEYDSDKINVLQDTVANLFPDQIAKCHFIQGDVNQELPACLDRINWKSGRAVAFLDPCSTQLSWETMKAFDDTCADVWCLFPIEAIIRMLPTDHRPDDSWAKRLDNVFGDTAWRDLYYQPNINQPNLFGEIDESYAREKGIEEVLAYVVKRYQTIFPGVIEPGILRGQTNNPLFALFALIANKSERAVTIASRIARYLIREINS